MPPPPDNAPPTPTPPVQLRSPRSAVERALVYRRRGSTRGGSRWVRIVALALSLLVHLVLFGALWLGPAYVPPPPPHDDSPLRVRLIDLSPEPPPPPPVRGTPPKQRGPLKQRSRSVVKRAAANEKPVAATPGAAPRAPSAAREPAKSVVPKPAAPLPVPSTPPSTPPSPQPELQPEPLAPPTIALDLPPLTPPVPPRFQPQPVRRPTTEGNQPVPPPASLANAEQPAQAPRINLPGMTVETSLPDIEPSTRPPLARPSLARQQMASAAPAPAELPPVPRVAAPARTTPRLDLQPQTARPAPQVIDQRPEQQAIEVRAAKPQPEPELQAVPIAPIAPRALEDLQATASPAESPAVLSVEINIARPQLSENMASVDASSAQADTPSATAAEAAEQAAASAPNATEQGSDAATPGATDGVTSRAPATAGDGRLSTAKPGQGRDEKATGKTTDKTGTNQGMAQGNPQGSPGTFIQVKPHGDTDIMQHRAPNIGYKPTRFEQDWAPQNETILDTALRRAVEKTTIEHIFHLPLGVRIKCVVMPLFPMVMLGCGNPDPPARVLDDEIYKRLNLAPLKPLAAPLPASAASIGAAAPVELDSAVQCASARVAGGPPPPDCQVSPSLTPTTTPAPTGSSWAPPSDQFQ